MEEFDATRMRKTRRSPSSTTSSVLHNHRSKKAALVRKRGGGCGGSTTPAPTWRIAASRSPSISLRIAAASETPRSQQPVSARKLAATLWEMNEVPLPEMKEGRMRRRRRERVESFSSLLPPHLSDPSHSPVSERSERSGTGTHRRRQSSSICRKLRSNDVRVFDSVSNASFMEIETRSRCQSQTAGVASTGGYRNRLKDVGNALVTSKELVKIISRMWVQEDNQPSTSMSLISALHAELERGRLQVNQLVQEQRSEKNEVSYLLQCFAEEKADWKKREKEAVREAIESVAEELEVERKLRRRVENLNKKLGKELAEAKASFEDAVKELESERRARGMVEKVCNDLAWNVGEDKVKVDELKRESVRMREEIEKEREMLHIADALREERSQMKLSDAKHHFEEKNAAVDQLRDELEAFLQDEVENEQAHAYVNHTSFHYRRDEEKEVDDGEVEDNVNFGEDSAESDLHSIELNMHRRTKGHRSGFASVTPRSSKKLLTDEESIGRHFISSGSGEGVRGQRRSTSLLRSVSNMVECGGYGESHQARRDGDLGFGYERFPEAHRRSSGDDLQRSKTVKGLREHILSNSRLGPSRNIGSPQWGQPWSRELDADRSMMTEEAGTRRRQDEARTDSKNARRSRQ